MIETQIIPRLMIVQNRENGDFAFSALTDVARFAALLMMEDKETSSARVAEIRAAGAEEGTIWVRMLDPAVEQLSQLLRDQLARGGHVCDGAGAGAANDHLAPPTQGAAGRARSRARRGEARDKPESE